MTAPTHRRTGPGQGHREPAVALGDGVTIGGPRLPVIARPGTGADAAHVTLGSVSRRELARLGESAALVVEAAGAHDLAAAAACGLPAVLRLPPGDSIGSWLGAIDSTPAAIGVVVGADPVALAELGRRADVPVIADVGERAGLAGVAVAAGADAIWLPDSATAADVCQAREAATRLAPLVRQVVPDTLAGCRNAIDAVDAVLATLLEHRVALAGRIQGLKAVGGHAGRDPAREAAIVNGMAARAPSVPPEHIARVMAAVIDAGLDVAERDLLDHPPAWRL